MSRRDPQVTLKQMRDHACEARDLVAGRSKADLERERVLNLALVRLLEILGEAATRIPVNQRSSLPGIPWESLVGLRNRLIHAYDQVDFDILWQILQKDLPVLISELDRIVARHP